MAETLLEVKQSQHRLGWIWMGGSGFLFTLILFQTLSGHYQDPKPVWDWFLPAVAPTVSLIVGSIVFAEGTGASKIDRSVFTVTWVLSVFYLAILLLALITMPLFGTKPVDLADRTMIFLPAVQALVGLALGRFFVARKG